jgi:hypothetical protein
VALCPSHSLTICIAGLATAERLLEWEANSLYPVILACLQAATLNKSPDTSLKSQLLSQLTALGTGSFYFFFSIRYRYF